MFGLEFLFSAALFALPLAALPLILHLLYRRKSPVVQFPTLRFIKASLQQSAARRKVQRWLLLAIRMLLMALLIWAVAQPARALATRFFSSAEQSVAVIVVDTSWSMQYRQNQVPLLGGADQIIQQLLRGELKDASVLVVTTNGGENGKFRQASEILSDWVPLTPAIRHEPLAERVMASAELLNKRPASQKLLVVISDFQSREFPRRLPQLAESQVRTVVIDLHPNQPRSSGIQAIALSPRQPIAGLRVTAEVEVAGPAGDVRPVQLAVTALDGKPLLARPPVMATFDSFGEATARFEFQMPQQRWQLVTASLQGDDPMPWDDTRSIVVELPLQQNVAVQDGSEATATARRLVRLALDPTEGTLANWPLRVQSGKVDQQTNAIVAVVDTVPDMATVSAWRAFVANGGTLVLMLKPGIEATWPATPAAQALEQMLPSKPYANTSDQIVHFFPGPAARTDTATMGLADDAKALADLRATRIVPISIADSRSTRILITGASGGRRPAVDREGLLYVKRVGSGRVFIWSCIPDALISNLGTHPLFLPLLVNQCLRPLDTSLATNTTIGDPITWDNSPTLAEMEIHTPANAAFRVPRSGTRFTYDQTAAPGLYEWFVPGQSEMKGVANATVLGEESQSIYRPADTLFPQSPNILIAHSLPEMQARIAEVTQPQPKWTMPLAIAMMLLCTESLLSTETGLWSWFRKK